MRRTILIAILGAMLTSAARAEVEFDLRVDTDTPYVNQPFTVTLTIQGYGALDPPDFPSTEQLAVGTPERNERSSINFVNGRAQSSSIIRLRYPVRARVSGDVVIPPIEFKVDGQLMRTQALRISVRPAEERPTEALDEDGQPLLTAEITCAESRLFVGQRARFTLRIRFKPAIVSGYSIRRDDLLDRFKTRRTSIAPFDGQGDLRDARIELPGGGSAVYHEFVVSNDLLMPQAGPLTFDEVTLGMDYPIAVARDRWRGAVISDSKELTIRPRVIAPVVEPLPTEGRPPNFSGAVGDYRLTASAAPVDVRVGDPITLTLTVTGRGDVEALPGPRLEQQESLTRDFRVPEEKLAGTVDGARKYFRQTVRAKHSGIGAIPPIEYAFFNPYAAEYRIARTAPIPIKVEAGEQVSPADLVEIVGAPTDSAPSTLTLLDGLRGNITDDAALLQSRPRVTQRDVWVAAGAPAGVFAAIWLASLAMSQSVDEGARRRARALREATRRLQDASGLEGGALTHAVQASIAGYLADRLNEPPARFVGTAALDGLAERGLSPDNAARVRGVLEACQAGAYGGLANGDRELLAQASECLSRLERERLK